MKEYLKNLWNKWRYGIDMRDIERDPNFPDKEYYPFFYKGVRAEQNPHIFEFLNELSLLTDAKKIFELGFRNGGFTSILNDHKISKWARIYAYDIEKPKKELDLHKVTWYYGDIFKQIDRIGSAIADPLGQSIVFCDGGDKNLEFQLLAPYLKKGDIILTHDYAPNKIEFENDYLNKRWDWFESWDGEQTKTILEQGLVPFCNELANNAVWSCRIKL